jgi:hypothetical protein
MSLSRVITDGRQPDDVREFHLLEEYCQGFDTVTSRAENSAFRLLLADYAWFRAPTIFTVTV